jgi:hypothetical protein
MTMSTQTIKNNPSKAGQLAGKKVVFGDSNRYAIGPVHSRLDCVQWFIWDADLCDSFVPGSAEVIVQAYSQGEALTRFLEHLRYWRA